LHKNGDGSLAAPVALLVFEPVSLIGLPAESTAAAVPFKFVRVL